MVQHVLEGSEKQQFLVEKCYTGVKAAPSSSLPNHSVILVLPFLKAEGAIFSCK